MDLLIIIIIICCYCSCTIIGGGYSFLTTQNSIKSINDDTTTTCIIPSTTPCIIPSTTPYIIPSTTPCIIPSTTPLTTLSNTYPKGVTIYSEANFKGKSLFLKSNDIGEKTYYDKSYFDTNWINTGIGSWQFSKGDEFMFLFNAKSTLGQDIYAGGDEPVTTLKRIFGASTNIIISEIVNVSIYTPRQYKEDWCTKSGDKIYESHFKLFPDSNCF